MSDLIVSDGPDHLPQVAADFNGFLGDPTTNPVACYLSRLAPTSRRSMLSALRSVLVTLGHTSPTIADVAMFPWAEMRYQHVAALRTALYEKYKPKSASHHISAVKSVLKEAWRLGQITGEDYNRAIDSSPIKSETLPAGRALAADELYALIAQCDQTNRGRRDAALIATLYGGMLRRAEVISIDMEAVDLESRQIKLLGKGRKERMVHLPLGTVKALAAWITVRGTGPGPLFYPVDAFDTLTPRRLTASGVTYLCRSIALLAGVKKFSPHDFRRTGISDALDAGVDALTVSKMVGHASPATTAIYDRRGERAKAAAAARLIVPYSDPAGEKKP